MYYDEIDQYVDRFYREKEETQQQRDHENATRHLSVLKKQVYDKRVAYQVAQSEWHTAIRLGKSKTEVQNHLQAYKRAEGVYMEWLSKLKEAENELRRLE